MKVELVGQCASRDAEQCCGARLVAATLLQRCEDLYALDAHELHTQLRRTTCPRGQGGARLRRRVPRARLAHGVQRAPEGVACLVCVAEAARHVAQDGHVDLEREPSAALGGAPLEIGERRAANEIHGEEEATAEQAAVVGPDDPRAMDRPGDPRFHAFTLMGPMLMGVLWRETLQPAGGAELDLKALATQHAETALAGLLK